MENGGLVYLVQTDTTVGFASKDAEHLGSIKERPRGKQFLQTVASLKEIKRACRVPKALRKRVRQAKKTTFVYPDGLARRLVDKGEYGRFLQRYGSVFSTSANQSGRAFDTAWAEKSCDAIIYTPAGFSEQPASAIYKMGKAKVIQLR